MIVSDKAELISRMTYRMLKLGYLPFTNRCLTSSFRQTRIKCSLCNRLYETSNAVGTLSRFQSTNASASTACQPVSSTGRKSSRKIKYTDLVEVLDKETNVRRAKVKTLTRKSLTSQLPPIDNLPLFVGTASEAESLTYKSDDGVESTSREWPRDEDGENDVPIGGESSTSHDEAVAKSKNGSVRGKKQSQINFDELERENKGKSLNKALICYLELCASCGFINRALAAVKHYLSRTDIGSISFMDVNVFNALLEGYARVGHFDKLMEVWELMRAHDVQPNELSFRYKIEAISRSLKHDKIFLISEALRMFENRGFEINSIFESTNWKRDSKEVVLKAIRLVRPLFTPKETLPDLSYQCVLVNHLNTSENSRMRSPVDGMFSKEEMVTKFKDQLDLESKVYMNVRTIEKETEDPEVLQEYRDKIEANMKAWGKCISSALHREINRMNAVHAHNRTIFRELNIYPYLVVLDFQQYKEIVLNEIRRLAEGSETFSPWSSYLYKELGNQVRMRYEVKMKKLDGVNDKLSVVYDDYLEWYLNPKRDMDGKTVCNGRECWTRAKHKHLEGPSIDYNLAPWPVNVQVAVGKFLFNIIMKDIKIDVNVLKQHSKAPHYLPAFYKVFRKQGHLSKEEIKPHPVLSRLFRIAKLPYLQFPTTDLPMECPPVPWSSSMTGAFLVGQTNLLRLPHQAFQQWERIKESPPSQIFPVLDSLNQLGSIPWKVNEAVLDVIINVFNEGGSSKLDIPTPPSSAPLPGVSPDMSKEERLEAYRKQQAVRRERAEMYSLWCDALYKLSLANHFRNKVFWLPHNMDFRGRVYPCAPHLNHLGSDMARSLLVFAKGERLGPGGLDWLKIHLVNLTGLKKKESVASRLEFANSILASIIDSAENPLHGEKWWVNSDEPWQTLACCMEIKKALASPDGPENFISHFPVHQDGSCNGLQHYAALGRDKAGAHSVNLSPSEIPQDVYSCVAALVERERTTDAERGDKIAQVLEGFVRRKVVKQTVMTTVYGVTRYGARLQIAKQLKDIDEFPKEHVWAASSYLVNKTFSSIREMFTSTREIQDWFTESARKIAMVCGQNMEYVTPLGLPVVQPYIRHSVKADQKRQWAGSFSYLQIMDMFEKPNVMKQKNAFPPNFIHSLDSSHMMLTSLHCERAGLTFVSVHDCYWTHPCNVNVMNKICREQFVALHSQPILQDLSEFLLKKYGFSERTLVLDKASEQRADLATLLRSPPPTGDFELKEVLDSVYFFS